MPDVTIEGQTHVEDTEIKPDAAGKYPDTVPWNKYVSTKETISRKLDAERIKVTGLEEKLKNAVNPEEFTKNKKELDDTKANLQKVSDELKGIKEKSASEKREILTKRGVPEDKVKGMSEDALNAAVIVLAHASKPGPDLGGGGGGAPQLKGSPIELARQAYAIKR